MSRKKLLSRNTAGFTLIEVMIALVIASIAFGGFIGANVVLQQNTAVLNERTLALQDANRAIEMMRNASRTTAPVFPQNVTSVYPSNSTIPGFNTLRDETLTVVHQDLSGNPASASTNPLMTSVTVAWTSYRGRANTATVRTYITQR